MCWMQFRKCDLDTPQYVAHWSADQICFSNGTVLKIGTFVLKMGTPQSMVGEQSAF